jgi:Zn-dependent protease with chaperone function
MYWVRCAIVSLIVFSLSYVVVSTLLALIWNAFQRRLASLSANSLFALRTAPLFIAYGLVTGFTLPSFFFFEPPSAHEGIRTVAIIGSACAIALLTIGVIRSFLAWRKTAKLVAGCIEQDPSAKPAVFITGIFRSRLMISFSARALLNERELAAAVRHESAHALRRDNLKQLILRFCAFPLLSSMDRTWLRAAEIAADDAAVSDEQSALDLASALATIARNSVAVPELGMSFVPENDAPLKARIERLLAWKPSGRNAEPRFTWFAIAFVIGTAVMLNAHTLFAQVHEITELLFVP